MRATVVIFFLFTVLLGLPNNTQPMPSGKVSFVENKGQVCDQNNQARPDVLFTMAYNNMSIHFKASGYSYQLYTSLNGEQPKENRLKEDVTKVSKTLVDRIDVNFVGCSSNPMIISEDANKDVDNYILGYTPKEINEVKNYNALWYRSIYSGIDLHYYTKEGNIKYDFVVKPGADHKQIEIEIKGATSIRINDKGQLVLSTPNGDVIEEKPLVSQGANKITASWKLERNIVSFNIGEYDHSKELIIDPLTLVRHWGSYFPSAIYDMKINNAGELMFCGVGASNTLIATVGAYQTTIVGGGSATVQKFNANGTRVWGTYYHNGAGFGYTLFNCMAIDKQDNIYLAGTTTNSISGLFASAGAFQTLYAGGSCDGIFAKFNTAGQRLYGSYYGDYDFDQFWSISVDKNKNVYMCGPTVSNGSALVTAGCHQPNYGGGFYDVMLVKFDSLFTRQWGTYYGGFGSEYASYVGSDKVGNCYLFGLANSLTNISSSGSYQQNFAGGSYDTYLAKFDKYGNRTWGTYFGGNNDDWPSAIVVDTLCNIYLGGYTGSTVNIASTGAYQVVKGGYGGIMDCFLARFDTTGVRIWGTYYGGSGDDEVRDLEISADKSMLLISASTSGGGTVFVTNDAHQQASCGAFYSVFDLNGGRIHSSYYGQGSFTDHKIYGVAMNSNSELFFGGTTTYSNTLPYSASAGKYLISTPGSFLPISLGNVQGFFVKMGACPGPGNLTFDEISHHSVTCTGGIDGWSYFEVYGGSGFSYTWAPLPSPSYTYVSAFLNGFNASLLPAGNYSFTVSNSCGSTTSTVITIAQPSLSLSLTANTSTVCEGDTVKLTANVNGIVTWVDPPYVYNSVSSGSVHTGDLVAPYNATMITVYAAASSSCPYTATASIPIHVYYKPLMMSFSWPTMVCVNSANVYTFSANFIPATTYSWNITNATTSVVACPVPLTNSVIVTAISSQGCKNTIAKPLNIKFPPLITGLQDTVFVCSNTDSVVFSPTVSGGVSPYIYEFNNWFSNSNPSFTFYPTQTETKHYYAHGGNGCIGVDSVYIIDICARVPESNGGHYSFKLYPNPTSGTFEIHGNSQQLPLAIEIVDVSGRLVRKIRFENEEIKVDLSQNSNGLYFVKLMRDGVTVYSFKVSKVQ